MQLLSAQVPTSAADQGSSQLGDSLDSGARLSALPDAPPMASSRSASTTPASSVPGGDGLLFTAMGGAALALAATAFESARRQRVRAATGRVRGRRALR